MSKLGDLIRRITRVEARPLGFASGSTKAAASMALVALVSERWSHAARDAAGAGAEAVLLVNRPGDKDVADAAAAAEDRPCGVLATDVDSVRLGKLRESGADFVGLDASAPASALAAEGLGFLLHVRDELSDTQLRTLESLSIDALFVESPVTPLTIERQMELRRTSGLARKALLLTVRPDAQKDDLLALRESGVILIAIDMKERGAPDAIKRLRGLIDELPQRKQHRDERGNALLPRAAPPAEPDAEDDDE